jgi:hypothetical protein
MQTRTALPVLAAALTLTALEASAGGAPKPKPPAAFEGRYYQVVLASRISWESARAAAESRTHQGLQGHLVTIGSPAEDEFVHQLRQEALGRSGSELWAGGYQTACATTAPEPGCGWLWTNGQSISPTNTDAPYTNWQDGEPNNLLRKPSRYQRAAEDHLAIGLGGAFGWNDEGNLANIAGYVIEYGDDLTIPAAECTAPGGCNPTGAQVQIYPASAQLEDDATLTARTWRIQDDPARCGVHPLTLFDGKVVIPPYLCGHPDIFVIETKTSGVEILTGAIDVENLTEDVLPGNLFGCDGVRQNPAGVMDPDPSHRDVVGWQSSNAADMLETSKGSGRYFGTVAEVTYGCGSSRGKVVEGSYHFIGLRIHPGVGNELDDGNPQANHQSFIELTRYKLELLRASVVESKPALPYTTFVVLKSLVAAAIDEHDCGQYELALAKIETFLAEVDHAHYTPIVGENFNGEHIMRGSNVKFMYEQKVIPFEH